MFVDSNETFIYVIYIFLCILLKEIIELVLGSI
jgi:hypothetical protein